MNLDSSWQKNKKNIYILVVLQIILFNWQDFFFKMIKHNGIFNTFFLFFMYYVKFIFYFWGLGQIDAREIRGFVYHSLLSTYMKRTAVNKNNLRLIFFYWVQKLFLTSFINLCFYFIKIFLHLLSIM